MKIEEARLGATLPTHVASLDMEKFFDSVQLIELIDVLNDLDYPLKHAAFALQQHAAPRVTKGTHSSRSSQRNSGNLSQSRTRDSCVAKLPRVRNQTVWLCKKPFHMGEWGSSGVSDVRWCSR